MHELKLTHPESRARELALWFLYQMEIQRVHFLSARHFEDFAAYQNLDRETSDAVLRRCAGVLTRRSEVDALIQESAANWSIQRLNAPDRLVLRLATHELLEGQTPFKVVLNEAIELGKLYGTEHSGRFVNGVLDAIFRRLKRSGVSREDGGRGQVTSASRKGAAESGVAIG